MHVFISRLYSEFLKCHLFYNKNLLNNILIGEDCVLFCIYVIFLLLSLKDSIQTQLTLAKCDQLSKKKKKIVRNIPFCCWKIWSVRFWWLNRSAMGRDSGILGRIVKWEETGYNVRVIWGSTIENILSTECRISKTRERAHGNYKMVASEKAQN